MVIKLVIHLLSFRNLCHLIKKSRTYWRFILRRLGHLQIKRSAAFWPLLTKGLALSANPLLVTVFSESARRFPFLYQKYASIGKTKKGDPPEINYGLALTVIPVLSSFDQNFKPPDTCLGYRRASLSRPGILSQPPFSMNSDFFQGSTFYNSFSFSSWVGCLINWATQIAS